MTSATRRPHTRLARLLAPLAAALLGLLGLAGTALPASADARTPQLSIAVDDGRGEVERGATLTYRVTLTNLGGSRLRDLAVSQTLPPGTTLVSASKGGKTGEDGVRWSVDLPAAGSVSLESRVTVEDEPPADLLRLATVVCARTSPKAAPTVCGSDSDQLPAGAAAAEQQRQLDAAGPTGVPGWLLPVGLGAVGVVLVAVLVPLAARTLPVRSPGRRAHGQDGPGQGSAGPAGSGG